MTEKRTDDDNDDCNDNYDSNDGNFDDSAKKIPKTYKSFDFSAKMYQFQGVLLGEEGAKKLGHR